MSLVDFAAGLAIGLVIGHRRTHAALSAMRPDLIVCTTVDGARGMAAEVLGAACDRAGVTHEVVVDPTAAVTRARSIASDEDTMVVTGSFRLLAPARAALVP